MGKQRVIHHCRNMARTKKECCTQGYYKDNTILDILIKNVSISVEKFVHRILGEAVTEGLDKIT